MMDNINEFLTQVVFPALATIVTTAITLFLAFKERRENKKEKADAEKEIEQKKVEIIETCIRAVEQMHKDVHGEDKLNACIDGAKQMFATAGIDISDFELEMRIEAILAKLNNVFNEVQDG